MRFLLVFVACCLLTVSCAAEEVVVDSNIEIFDGSALGTEFNFRVYQDPQATDETNIYFDCVNFIFDGNQTFFATLQFVDTNIDEGSDWYLVEPGDAFTANNVCGGQFDLWGGSTKNGKDLILGNEIIVPAGTIGGGASSIFLAVNTGSFSEGPGLPREIFGWVEFNIFSTGNLEILNSAVSYDATGITVGRDFLFGDVNCDGSADLLDIQPFVDLLTSGNYAASADFDNNGLITLLDVSPFVDAISNN